jgi:hypothetical protein
LVDEGLIGTGRLPGSGDRAACADRRAAGSVLGWDTDLIEAAAWLHDICQVVLASAKGSTEDAPAWRSNRAAKVIVQPVSMRSSISNMGPEVLDTAVATSSGKLSRRHRSANRWALFARRGGGPSEVSVPKKSSRPIAAS